MKTTIFTALLTLTILTAMASTDTIYVPDDYDTIQEAIDEAVGNDTILVEPGTYYENLIIDGISLKIRSDVDGNPATHDISPTTTIIDGSQWVSPSWYMGVVYFTGDIEPDTILEGFTLTNGEGTKVHSSGYRKGGAIFIEGEEEQPCSPTIEGCIIDENEAYHTGIGGSGGGINCEYSEAIIKNNIIRNNTATMGGGVQLAFGDVTLIGNEIHGNEVVTVSGSVSIGGGIHVYLETTATIENNIIYENTASKCGGGIGCYTDSTPKIHYNIIYGNDAVLRGGGIYCEEGATPKILGNMIYHNDASGVNGKGGGIACDNMSYPKVVNNTIYGNTATVSLGGIQIQGDADPIITNCIVWGNTSPQISAGSLDVTYCNVQGGYTGTGNINTNPLFIDHANYDLHLRHDSPCKDAGDDESLYITDLDFEGDPRIADSDVDMGADEFYIHLYYTGNATPSGTITLVFIGEPRDEVVY